MKMYKNLCVYLLALCFISFCFIYLLSTPSFEWVHIAFISAPVSTFAVSIVCLLASFVMYKSLQNAAIQLLKRRAGRVYGELIYHKMRLIDVVDGKIAFADLEKYLYPEDAFLKIKKFLYEEFFFLFTYDPFFKTSSYRAVKAFYQLHKELETFIRSQNYDIIEYNKLKVLYQKIYRQPLLKDTPEENLKHPDLIEAVESFHSGLDYALLNTDTLMSYIEEQLINLDTYFAEGVPWPITKAHYDNEFQLWMHANS